MSRRPPLPDLPGVRRGARRGAVPRTPDGRPPRWGITEVTGRLVELSSRPGPTAVLTLAVALVRDAQRHGETAAWVGPWQSLPFPPDMERSGVDLAAFPIVRVPGDLRSTMGDVPRAAERLVRSGAFGLVVLDLTFAGPRVRVPPALLNRLAALAREHDSAVVCLTEKPDGAPSLGPLVSLRAAARRDRSTGPAPMTDPSTECRAVLDVLRDRRRPGRRRETLPCLPPEGVGPLLR